MSIGSEEAGRGKLTEAQQSVLLWLPATGAYRPWGGRMFSAPSKAAVKACIRRGLVEKVGHPDMDLYALTPAGAAKTQPGISLLPRGDTCVQVTTISPTFRYKN